jgi:hypothetical protein
MFFILPRWRQKAISSLWVYHAAVIKANSRLQASGPWLGFIKLGK